MTVHDQLRSLLASVRRRWRAEVSLRAVGRGSALAAGPLLAGAGLAALFAPGDRALIALALTISLVAFAAVVATAWRVGRTPADPRVARFVEERAAARGDVPPFDDVVVSAASAAARPAAGGGQPGVEPTPFLDLVVESAVRRLQAIGAAGIVTPRALRRAGAEALAGVVMLAVATVLAWPMLARASEAAWIALVPQSIHVEVLPGDTRVPAGKPLTIRASVRAGATLLTRFTPVLTVDALPPTGADVQSVAMTADGGGFQFSLPSVDRTFRYRVTAGSRQSQDYTVTALIAPRVTRIDLHYDYPAFTRLAPREERDGGDIYAPAGTRVRVRVHTDKPIASGQMLFARAAPGVKEAAGRDDGGLQPIADQVLEGELILARDDSYRIGLTDRDGLRSSGETEYFLRVMDDRPPDVRILRPAADQQITPLEEVAIEARAEDDYGISGFELVYAVAGRAPKVVAFARSTGSTLARAGSHTLAAEDLGVQPGDVITYYARARDVGRGKRPTETRSDIFFLEVRPFSEEFVLAQSQAMSGMASEQIETLIAAQKEIINATWNIERRAASGAGRSSADITAIRSAQAELKTRAEEIASRSGRGRGAMRFPQQVLPLRPFDGAQGRPFGEAQGRGPQGRPSADPVGAAISAMTRAIDQLEEQRTGQALPHEMAALQGLVQAQAEVRRREVAQQAGAAMGGLGRQGQDMSALFDKELQRQQRTNYETRSQAETRPDRQDSETALDRIRDLARRQEELNRRQRELAKSAQPADAVKRQLEKLSREQEALRQQAEELARELAREMGRQAAGHQPGQPAGQPQRGGTSPAPSGSGGAVRDAADEMRRAAGELQRQSPSTAAERGERAASGLRRLEQQMRRDNPDARQQAAGEARLEAQQIAGEQRRIAGEATRLSKGADAANRDAWRRLAGEKNTLADRVDDLQRSIEQVGRGEPAAAPGSTGHAAAAAKEIARQQIAGRMRDGARTMREAAEPQGAAAPAGQAGRPAFSPGLAETEQQLAKALEQIAGQLAGGAAGAGDLSRQLDASRAIRDRLDRLERQMRNADARSAAGGQAPGRTGAQGAGRSSTPGAAAGSGQSSVPAEEAQRLREEYARELRGARESLARLERGAPGTGIGGSSPEEHEWSAVDQGTEAFKQDFSTWESLRQDVNSALERYEASVIATAARRGLPDRLNAGGSDRAPDDYRQVIARYYESLAKKK